MRGGRKERGRKDLRKRDRGEYNNREGLRRRRAGKVREAVKGRKGHGEKVAKRNRTITTTIEWAREGESVAVG